MNTSEYDGFTSDSDDDEAAYSSGNEQAPHSRSQSPSNSRQYQSETSRHSRGSLQLEGCDITADFSSFSKSQTKSANTSASSTGSFKGYTPQHQTNPSKEDDTNWTQIVSIVVIILVGIWFVSSKFMPEEVALPIKVSCPQFRELTNHFNSQDMILWKSLKVGIEGVLNNKPTTPSVFLLAYSDPDTVNRVMKEVLAATSSCMNSSNPIQLDGRTFVTQDMIADYGIIIDKYRDQLTHEGIMYVSDFNEVPAEAAQVFHTICDTITPLVHRAVIFLTVRVDQTDKDLSSRKLSELIEHELITNWYKNKKVSRDTLQALIGRVTDQLFLLQTEK